MPGAISKPQRHMIVNQHQQGVPLAEIAQRLGLSYWSVRQIWRQYRDHGEAGLETHYAHTAQATSKAERRIYRAAIWLKRHHSQWGGGLIRVLLQQRWPECSIADERTLQRWFKQVGVNQPHQRHPQPPRQRAQQVHEVWQMDGKSYVGLSNGEMVSWLSLVDECSGALLEVEVFPLSGI